MKKKKQDIKLEEYLEQNASQLIDADEDINAYVKDAKSDMEERKNRALELQKLRKERLQMTQGELAKAVGANLRTLQSWERGRQDFPKSVEILMKLMNDIPVVKKRLFPKNKAA